MAEWPFLARHDTELRHHAQAVHQNATAHRVAVNDATDTVPYRYPPAGGSDTEEFGLISAMLLKAGKYVGRIKPNQNPPIPQRDSKCYEFFTFVSLGQEPIRLA